MFASNSLLFVPGSRGDRFQKAAAAGAGVTVIDLEDAVPAKNKLAARTAALAHVADRGGSGWAIRINPVATAAGIADLAALEHVSAPEMPQFLMLPMVDSPRDCAIVAQVLGDRCPELIPLIESPCALRRALDIAKSGNVGAVMFGGGDFAAELGVKLAWTPLLAARQQLILACAEATVPAIDVPFIHLDDADALGRECAASRALGFRAKAAIHPRQIAAIEAAFAPGQDEVNEAAEALRAYNDAGGAAIVYKGRMLDAPIVKQYRAVIERSRTNQTERLTHA
ncbi:hypothetical protein A9995_14395 [Erythrobacter sp. QSSC1-22B]|nr:hypothetical protein A9995_14395 [Erythrobacter sp. QSSC1-22B]